MNATETTKKPRKRSRGEGTVYHRPDGRWEAALPKSMTGGKRVCKYAKTERETKALLKKLVSDFENGLNIASARRTVGDYLEAHFRDVVQVHRRAGTIRSYRQTMDSHILPALGNIPLEKLDPPTVRAFLNDRIRSGLSANTVRIIRANLAAALKQAERDGLIRRNPVGLCPVPKVERTEQQFLDEDKARKLLDVCADRKFGVAFVVAIMTGLRKGELLGLRWQDIDLETGTVNVVNQLQRVEKPDRIRKDQRGERGENSELKLVPLKTAKSRRTVILPPGALELLKQHKAEQMIQASMMEDGWKQTGFVFTSEIGTPVEPRNLNKAFKGALKSAGLPQDIRVHDLRHSTASLMLAKGVDLKVVSDQLGHSTIRLTADTYIHTVEKTKREAAAKMQELFG